MSTRRAPCLRVTDCGILANSLIKPLQDKQAVESWCVGVIVKVSSIFAMALVDPDFLLTWLDALRDDGCSDGGDARLEAGTKLWDVSADAELACFLVEHSALPLLLGQLVEPDQGSARLHEICVGTLANLVAAVPNACTTLTRWADAPSVFVSLLLGSSDAGTLTELLRLLSTVLSQLPMRADGGDGDSCGMTAATQRWLTTLGDPAAIAQTLFILQNTLRAPLCQRAAEMLSTLLSCAARPCLARLVATLRQALALPCVCDVAIGHWRAAGHADDVHVGGWGAAVAGGMGEVGEDHRAAAEALGALLHLVDVLLLVSGPGSESWGQQQQKGWDRQHIGELDEGPGAKGPRGQGELGEGQGAKGPRGQGELGEGEIDCDTGGDVGGRGLEGGSAFAGRGHGGASGGCDDEGTAVGGESAAGCSRLQPVAALLPEEARSSLARVLVEVLTCHSGRYASARMHMHAYAHARMCMHATLAGCALAAAPTTSLSACAARLAACLPTCSSGS